MRLSGKVAIITGAAHGIGQATARLFAAEGARVVVADRDVEAGEASVATIRAAGGEAAFIAADVSRDADVERLVRATVERYGGLDVLVNNAGVSIGGSVVDTEPARWQRVLDVNLTSLYRTCRAAIPHMVQRGGGAIVNIASLQAVRGFPGFAAYAAAKAGILGLTQQIVVEYAAQRIRANAISPGGITSVNKAARTEQLEPGFARMPPPSGIARQPTTAARAADLSPLAQPGAPEDIAHVALFLASDEARHVNGQNIIVDGGASVVGLA